VAGAHLVDKITQAIILNAGEGKRLRPLTLETPKCLLAVGDNTILENQLSKLINCGITDVVMVLGYKPEKIMEFSKCKFPNHFQRRLCKDKYCVFFEACNEGSQG
jgi:NDP-sugar pyrophosphorylase family protein